MTLGYFLSCEEYSPAQLIEQAVLAEAAGFDALWISDHFHPWNDNQGESAFVWAVIGAISQKCELPVTTAVTCPTMRMSPAMVAQAAATASVMLNGNFRLGVGTGEALNEHIHGESWPSEDVRLEMLEEAVEIMRSLWSGEFINHYGDHYTVDQARIYTLPDEPPPIYMSGFGPKSAAVAGRIADGFISTKADKELVATFRSAAGNRPAAAGFKVCWAPSEDQGVDLAHRLWASAGLPGELAQVLPSPRHFEQASTLVTKEMTKASTVCGNDIGRHAAAYQPYLDAGFDEIYVANIGPHYREMIARFGSEVLPVIRQHLTRRAA